MIRFINFNLGNWSSPIHFEAWQFQWVSKAWVQQQTRLVQLRRGDGFESSFMLCSSASSNSCIFGSYSEVLCALELSICKLNHSKQVTLRRREHKTTIVWHNKWANCIRRNAVFWFHRHDMSIQGQIIATNLTTAQNTLAIVRRSLDSLAVNTLCDRQPVHWTVELIGLDDSMIWADYC